MASLAGQTVLVTGGGGFVGANIVRRLLAQGVDVYPMIRPKSDSWRLRDIGVSGSVMEGDVAIPQSVQRVFEEVRPDGVVHCAVHGGYSWQNECMRILSVSFLGSVNVVRSAESVGTSWFLNTGSSSEYGLKCSPMNETDLLEPVTDYGVAKAAATLFCQSFARKHKMWVATLRLFSPYGCYEEEGRLIPYLMISHARRAIAKLASPSSVRDFVHIDDVVDAYMSVLSCYSAIPSGSIFNVGSAVQSSTADVVRLLGDASGRRVHVEWETRPSTEPAGTISWIADIGKLKRATGWQPRYDLRSGLMQAYDWFTSHLQLYVD